MKNIRLRDLPSFVRSTDINDFMLHFLIREIDRTSRASAVIINTFDSFEQDVLDALYPMFPPIYTFGPLQLLVDQIPNGNLKNHLLCSYYSDATKIYIHHRVWSF
jgi:hypothetical protein